MKLLKFIANILNSQGATNFFHSVSWFTFTLVQLGIFPILLGNKPTLSLAQKMLASFIIWPSFYATGKRSTTPLCTPIHAPLNLPPQR
jgi:hypothetical protein